MPQRWYVVFTFRTDSDIDTNLGLMLLGMLNVGVWIETCRMGMGKGCCIEPGSDSCCNDTDTWFDFKPGWVQAALNDSGLDRLGHADYTPISTISTSNESGRTTSVILQASTTITGSCTNQEAPSQNDTSGSDDITPDMAPRNSGFSSAAIAVVSILSGLLVASWAALVVLWMKYEKWKKTSKVGVAELHGDTSIEPHELVGYS